MENYFNNFDKKYINFITDYIDKNYPNKRKSKYTTHYYISNIFYILRTGIPWRALIIKSHYTTIYKKFIYWNDLKVFENIYDYLLILYLRNNIIKNTYIDASHIKNIGGTDDIGKNHYDRFRNSTKLHLLIDQNRIPLIYAFTAGNIHDNKLTKKLSDKLININKDKRRSINIIGDRGYINHELKNNLKKNKINLYTPLKKNNKNIINKKKYMKKYNSFNRIIIENIFCRLDKFKKIFCRYEKLSINFKAFHLIAFSYIIYNYKSY